MALKIDAGGMQQPEPPQPPPIGDNSKAATLAELLWDKYPDLKRERDSLKERSTIVADPVQTEAEQRTAADVYVELVGFEEKVEAIFRNEKAPWLVGSRACDNFRAELVDDIEQIRRSINARSAAYLEWKKREADRKLREAKDKADREAREAQETAKKKADDAKKAAAEAAAKIAAKEGISKRSAMAFLPAAVVRKQEAATDAALTAQQANRRADHVDQRLASSAASKVRTRSGSAVATLAEEWDFRIIDFKKVPVGDVWAFLKLEHIEEAIRARMKTGRRDVKGVQYFKAAKANIRR